MEETDLWVAGIIPSIVFEFDYVGRFVNEVTDGPTLSFFKWNLPEWKRAVLNTRQR